MLTNGADGGDSSARASGRGVAGRGPVSSPGDQQEGGEGESGCALVNAAENCFLSGLHFLWKEGKNPFCK